MSSTAVLKPTPLLTPEDDKQISPSKSEGGKSTESGFSYQSGGSNGSKEGRYRPQIGIMMNSCADQVRKVNLRHFGL